MQRRTNTSPDIVDDACMFVWQQFMRYQPDRDRNWRAWLVTTAEREAWRLTGVELRHVPFGVPSDGEEPAFAENVPKPFRVSARGKPSRTTWS